MALLLIRERSRLVAKLLETRKHSSELEQQLAEERERVQSVSAELDRQLAECEQLCGRLASAESLNRSLQAELSQLQSLPPTATTTAVVTGLSRPTQSPRIAAPAPPVPDYQQKPVSASLSCLNLSVLYRGTCSHNGRGSLYKIYVKNTMHIRTDRLQGLSVSRNSARFVSHVTM